MTVDFGTDVSCSPDLDPLLEARSGVRVLAEALVRRLQTPRGSLFYAPSYGYDLKAVLLSRIDRAALARIRASIMAELRHDERVDDLEVALSFDAANEALSVRISVATAAGPFALTLAVTSVSLDILEAPWR
jgi:phage baseplate assembly protein W